MSQSRRRKISIKDLDVVDAIVDFGKCSFLHLKGYDETIVCTSQDDIEEAICQFISTGKVLTDENAIIVNEV